MDCYRTSTSFYPRNLLAKELRKNMLVAAQFIEPLISKYGEYPATMMVVLDTKRLVVHWD